MMKPGSRWKMAVVAVGVPVCVWLAAPSVLAGYRAASFYASHRAGNCTFTESLRAASVARRQYESREQLSAASRVVRQDGPYSLWRTPDGDFWMPTASRDAVVYDLAEQRRDIYGSQIRPGAVVLDAGASVGVFTRKALRAGAAKVVAIEPAPENLECLRRNFAKEIAAGTVVVYPKGVWDKDDVLKLTVDPGNSARDTFVTGFEGAHYVEAPLTTIDKLAAELQLPRVDFIKMDIEGSERRAIAGARSVIARFHPHMALCIYHVNGDETAVPELVRGIYAGYQVSRSCLCTVDRVQPEVAFFD